MVRKNPTADIEELGFDGVSGRNCNNSDVNMTKSESHKVNSKRLEPVRQLTGLNTVKIQLFVKE
ncbi:14585_t:CDS:2 [Entrophospora sp. SA101]|nr:14585_t:CDS:2 [Entrophospora sp. SA101]